RSLFRHMASSHPIIPGLEPGPHVFELQREKTEMAATSAAMTGRGTAPTPPGPSLSHAITGFVPVSPLG
ncbi:hypothetical protein, partial [Microvirga pakistanensis]|uniref:hypothetical protein n=1 Tax=Microvirga pakistanensis TaxID=1682650 RepID=UPI00195D2812